MSIEEQRIYCGSVKSKVRTGLSSKSATNRKFDCAQRQIPQGRFPLTVTLTQGLEHDEGDGTQTRVDIKSESVVVIRVQTLLHRLMVSRFKGNHARQMEVRTVIRYWAITDILKSWGPLLAYISCLCIWLLKTPLPFLLLWTCNTDMFTITSGLEVRFTTPEYELNNLLHIRCQVAPNISVTTVIYYKGIGQDQHVFVWNKDNKKKTKSLGSYKNRDIHHKTNRALGIYDLLLLKPVIADEGIYWCNMHGPLDWGIQDGYVTLVAPPEKGPQIIHPKDNVTSNHTCSYSTVYVITPSSTIRLVCNTPPSRPPTNITWFINLVETSDNRSWKTDLAGNFSNKSSEIEIELKQNVQVECRASIHTGIESKPIEQRTACIELKSKAYSHTQTIGTPAIIGIVFGVIATVVALICLVVCIFKNQTKNNKNTEYEPTHCS